eukprot:166261_1
MTKMLKTLWWQKLLPFRDITKDVFCNHVWQTNHSITSKNMTQFLVNLQCLNDNFIKDVSDSLAVNTMSTRVTPYILSLINWTDPYNDPLRKQFIPTYSTKLPDHPQSIFDQANEQNDSPVNGIVHRYPNKALFLATSVCPVYCRFCLRSYSIGPITEQIPSKKRFIPSMKRLNECIQYISETQMINDVLISGGDISMLPADTLEYLGMKLLEIKHVKRIRIASKVIVVSPSKILNDDEWFNAIMNINNTAYRQYGKHFSVQTHFNHPNEISEITEQAMQKLMKHQIIVRNQSVFMKDINADFKTMNDLISMLSNMNIIPYYVFAPDLISGAEEFRVSLEDMINVEKQICGQHSTGYMIPKFVLDLPKGGGKKIITSFESYENGIAHYKSNIRRDGNTDFYYYDPL